MFKIEIYRSNPNELTVEDCPTIADLATAFDAAYPTHEGNERVANVIGFDMSREAPFNRIMSASRDDRA